MDSSTFEDDSFRDDDQPGPSHQASHVIEQINGAVTEESQTCEVSSQDSSQKFRKVVVNLRDYSVSQEAANDSKRKRSSDGQEQVPPPKKAKTPRRPSAAKSLERRRSLRSSSSDSRNSVKNEKTPAKAVKVSEPKKVLLAEPAKAFLERKRSLRSASVDSSENVKAEKQSPVVVRVLRSRSKTPVKAATPKKMSRVEELRSSDSESGPRRPRSARKTRIASSSDSSTGKRKTAASAGSVQKAKAAKSLARNRTSKIVDSESDSESTSNDASRKAELKSRLNPRLDSNSSRKSSIFIRNDYLKNSSDKQTKFSVDFSRMVQKLSTTVEATKVNDPTYVAPPKIRKRERLRTSAFKGNDDDLSGSEAQDSAVIDTRPPSVSRDSSDEESSQPLRAFTKVQKFSQLHKVKKKVFVQETVEPANEKKVPYPALLEVIRTSLPNKKLGRVTTGTKEDLERKRKENLEALKSLEFLVCGSCSFKVTKHKWIDHYLSHGGLAWIDKFEPALNMNDWNDLLRRSINAFRIFDVAMATCPHCGFQRKSALGHMSHMLACGESQEVVEARKYTCELCEEKFFPFNATHHKKICKKAVVSAPEGNDGDDEVESEGEDVKTKSFNGRMKRQATRK